MTAMLGAVMCASDLDMYEAAAEDFRTFREEWAGMARTRLAALLDLDNAPRLLDGRYVHQLPASDLVAILDFAKDESRGIGWIDELRRGFGAVASFASNVRPISDEALTYCRKLQARNDVLRSYESHFDDLSVRRMTVSRFSEVVAQSTENGQLALLVPVRS